MAKRPYVAIWIEDADRRPVRTIALLFPNTWTDTRTSEVAKLEIVEALRLRHHVGALDQPSQAGDVWREPTVDTAETGVQAVIVRVLPANCVAYCRSGAEAGPRTTRPLVSNVEPWHGHTKVWLAKPVIVHVWCVQVAPRAMKDS